MYYSTEESLFNFREEYMTSNNLNSAEKWLKVYQNENGAEILNKLRTEHNVKKLYSVLKLSLITYVIHGHLKR